MRRRAVGRAAGTGGGAEIGDFGPAPMAAPGASPAARFAGPAPGRAVPIAPVGSTTPAAGGATNGPIMPPSRTTAPLLAALLGGTLLGGALAGCGTAGTFTTRAPDGGSPLAAAAAAAYGVVPTAAAAAPVAPAAVLAAAVLPAAVFPAAHQEPAENAAPVTPAPPPLPVEDGGEEEVAAVPVAADAGATLAEWEAAAVAGNPTLAGAAAAVRKAQGILEQVGLRPNPTVGYVVEDVGEGGSAGKVGLFASQTFVTGDKLELNRAVESREIEGLRWRAEAQRLRVLGGVRRRFYLALGAQRRAELAGELIAVAEEGVAAAEELVAAGEVATPDVLQVKIQLGEVRIARRDAELDYEAAWRALAAAAGTPARPVGRLSGELDGPAAVGEFEDVYRDLLASSPVLRAARARVARARAAVCRQRAQPIPNVLTQASLAYGFGGDEPVGGFQVGLPLPVFNDNRGNVAAAVADLRRAAADLARLELDLRGRLADALRNVRRAENRATVLADDVLPAARENLALTQAGYLQGEFDVVRVFTARRSLFEATLARVNALTDLRTAAVVVENYLLTDPLDAIPDAGGDNLQGVGLRELTLNPQ